MFSVTVAAGVTAAAAAGSATNADAPVTPSPGSKAAGEAGYMHTHASAVVVTSVGQCGIVHLQHKQVQVAVAAYLGHRQQPAAVTCKSDSEATSHIDML
jgi:hypothetical protein